MAGHDTGEFIRVQSALAGRYFLERELGRGGMGVVYLARDVALDRLVALKLLPSHLAADPALRQRFLNEARTAARLSHPNIVPIFSVDEVADLVFFVMAFVDGETLGQRVRARGPVPASECARILREVAWGLAYAHAQGVVHRDVKADNILLETGSGRALVADFGIARVAQNTSLTDAGEIVGTADYMSPEQAGGSTVDNRSDIYSLGVVAFYALAGRLPFEGPTAAAILAKHITQPAPRIADVCDGVPGKLANAVDRCLAKRADDRFQKAEDLADAATSVLELRRDVPVPIRVFVKKSGEFSRTMIGVAFLQLTGTITAIGLATTGEAELRSAAAVIGVAVVVLSALPVFAIPDIPRSLLRAGYTRAELVATWGAALERERDERVFEHGRGRTTLELWMRWLAVGGVVSIVAGAAMWSFAPLPLGYTAMIVGGMVSLWRYDGRTDLGGRLMGKFWRSRVGRWAFKLAGLGLKRAGVAPAATQRPTELAIGMAVDSLFDALPKPLRQQLVDLPKVVRALETDAMGLRGRVEELNAAIAKIEARARTGARGDALASKRDAVGHDLHAARNAAQHRMADAVTALEGIRLNLLRVTAGAGSLDTLTADLAAARGVSEDVRRLLEGYREAEDIVSRPATSA